VDNYDIFVSEDDAQILISNVIQFHKTMGRKVRGARKGTSPVIKDHKFLNFKEIKRLPFPKTGGWSFNWGDVNKLLSNMEPYEGYFFANYEWDYLSYAYSNKFGKRPGVYRIVQTRYDKAFITDFFTYFKPPNNSVSSTEIFGDNDLELCEFTLALEEGLYLNYDQEDLSIYYDKDKHLEESDENPMYYFLRLVAGFKKQSHEKNKIHVVYKGDYGFEKTSFDVKKIDINIDDNYNDDFGEVAEEIISTLNDKKKTGLYILNGDPGTGKTSFIRYLSGKVNRNIIFVSPDMVDYITDPAFIPFLMSNSDSILIIEDAEPALQKRSNGGGGRSGAISNILNLTDGLLSDCLNISIVATFNTSTKVIDDALLRKGRLIKSYTFENLVAHKSKKLLKKLGHDVEVEKGMSLADIYYYGEDNKIDTFGNTKTVGFK